MTYFSKSSWGQFSTIQGLDARLARAIPSLKFTHPTRVQEDACPAILSGRDVLITSPTGTGKSLAYLIPMFQRLISTSQPVAALSMVILVPTKELAAQVYGVCSSLSQYISDEVSIDWYPGEDKYRRPSLPSVFITTPRGLVQLCKSVGGHKQAPEAKENIKYIAIDEADLVLSQGFEKDIRSVVSTILPKEYQAVLVSATLSADLETLKGLLLRDPLSVLIKDQDISNESSVDSCKTTTSASQNGKTPKNKPSSGVRQYIFPCPAAERYLCLYGLLKLEIAAGKILIFTSTTDGAYRLKIFFDKFAVKSGVFNTEMPLECRNRVLSAYNEDIFSILIASSGGELSTSDPETSVSHRGIDFSNVNVVINFDMPHSVETYIHRAGRTGRGGKGGSVVTFVDFSIPAQESMVKKISAQKPLENINLTVATFEQLRYRVEDVYRGISRRAIAAARQKELLTEILHNDQLKKKLSENSEEIQALRQSVRNLREHAKVKWHLQQLPDYITIGEQLEGTKSLGQERGPDVTEKVRKRKSALERELRSNKRQKFTLRDKLLHKENSKNTDPDMTSPEELAPISGRKLWKIRHHKSIQKGSTVGKPPRVARKLWKSAKKFGS